MRLIDADALKAKLKIGTNTATYSDYCNGYFDARQVDLDAIDAAPTIEPEVRRGRWIRNAMSDGYHCSNCGHHADSPIGEMIDPRDYECYLDKYCGGCGAQMYADGGTISKERFAEIMTEILGGADNGS